MSFPDRGLMILRKDHERRTWALAYAAALGEGMRDNSVGGEMTERQLADDAALHADLAVWRMREREPQR